MNIVIFGATDGLYALDVSNGKTKWATFKIRGGITTNLVLAHDTVYFGGGNGRLYAIDPKTGTSRGSVWRQGGVDGIPYGEINSDITQEGDNIYFVNGDSILYNVSLANGGKRWATRLETTYGRAATPIINNDALYISTGSALTCVTWKWANPMGSSYARRYFGSTRSR